MIPRCCLLSRGKNVPNQHWLIFSPKSLNVLVKKIWRIQIVKVMALAVKRLVVTVPRIYPPRMNHGDFHRKVTNSHRKCIVCICPKCSGHYSGCCQLWFSKNHTRQCLMLSLTSMRSSQHYKSIGIWVHKWRKCLKWWMRYMQEREHSHLWQSHQEEVWSLAVLYKWRSYGYRYTSASDLLWDHKTSYLWE